MDIKKAAASYGQMYGNITGTELSDTSMQFKDESLRKIHAELGKQLRDTNGDGEMSVEEAMSQIEAISDPDKQKIIVDGIGALEKALENRDESLEKVPEENSTPPPSENSQEPSPPQEFTDQRMQQFRNFQSWYQDKFDDTLKVLEYRENGIYIEDAATLSKQAGTHFNRLEDESEELAKLGFEIRQDSASNRLMLNFLEGETQTTTDTPTFTTDMNKFHDWYQAEFRDTLKVTSVDESTGEVVIEDNSGFSNGNIFRGKGGGTHYERLSDRVDKLAELGFELISDKASPNLRLRYVG